MKKIYVFIISGLVAALTANAQTNPAAFDLSAGDYSFTEWSEEEPGGTFPVSMAFHFMRDVDDAQYDRLANGTQDFNCGYDLGARPRVNGLGEEGVSFLTTGSPQRDDCESGSAAVVRYMGATVLALNTTGRTNVQVTWTGGTLTVGNGGGTTGSGIPRIYSLELQYRVGTEGDFIDIENAEYVTNEVDHSEQITTTLPAECLNQAEVQIRWLYTQHESTPEGAQGTRPQLRLDDITVTSEEDITIGIDHNIITTISAHPNPSSTGIFMLSKYTTGTVYDLLGKELKPIVNMQTLDLSAYPTGLYVLRTNKGEVLRLMR